MQVKVEEEIGRLEDRLHDFLLQRKHFIKSAAHPNSKLIEPALILFRQINPEIKIITDRIDELIKLKQQNIEYVNVGD